MNGKGPELLEPAPPARDVVSTAARPLRPNSMSYWDVTVLPNVSPHEVFHQRDEGDYGARPVA